MANDWGGSGDTSEWGDAQAAPTQFNMNPAVTGWGDYLRGQEAQYQMARPDVADITQGPYQQKFQTVMGDLGAGQRNATDEYVKRAALTGVQRGGYSPNMGVNPQASLQQDAIKNLASGYGQNYSTALNYMQQLAAAQQAQYGQAQGQLSNLWGLQSTGLGQGLQDIQGQRGYDVNLRQLQDAATQRGWQGGQNTQAQQAQAALAAQQQAWQGAQNTQQQGWQGGQNTQAQEAELLRQQGQEAWQGGQNTQQQGWQGGQNTQQQGWQGTQNTQQQESQAALQAAQNAAAMQRLNAQNTWQTGQTQQQNNNAWQNQVRMLALQGGIK